jgi:hypothetical protein
MIEVKVIVPIAAFVFGVLAFLHTLLIKRKEATIEAQEKELARLKLLLEEAKNNSPDILADRYVKKINRYENELKELMKESEADSAKITETLEALQAERIKVALLSEQMNTAIEVLSEYEYFKEQFSCPFCGAEVTTLASEDDSFYTAYACGYSDGSHLSSPCPHDPEFPKLDEYEFTFFERGDTWHCVPKPKQKEQRSLTLTTLGERRKKKLRAVS